MVVKVEDCPRPRAETRRLGVASDPYGRPHRPRSSLMEVARASAANPQHRSDTAGQILLHCRDRRGPRPPGSPPCTTQTPDGRRGAMVRRTHQQQTAMRDRRARSHATPLTGRWHSTRCAVSPPQKCLVRACLSRAREMAGGTQGCLARRGGIAAPRYTCTRLTCQSRPTSCDRRVPDVSLRHRLVPLATAVAP